MTSWASGNLSNGQGLMELWNQDYPLPPQESGLDARQYPQANARDKNPPYPNWKLDNLIYPDGLWMNKVTSLTDFNEILMEKWLRAKNGVDKTFPDRERISHYRKCLEDPEASGKASIPQGYGQGHAQWKWYVHNNMKLENGLLYKKKNGKRDGKPMAPVEEWFNIFLAAHVGQTHVGTMENWQPTADEPGHLGRDTTWDIIEEYFSVSPIKEVIREAVKRCPTCIERDKKMGEVMKKNWQKKKEKAAAKGNQPLQDHPQSVNARAYQSQPPPTNRSRKQSSQKRKRTAEDQGESSRQNRQRVVRNPNLEGQLMSDGPSQYGPANRYAPHNGDRMPFQQSAQSNFEQDMSAFSPFEQPVHNYSNFIDNAGIQVQPELASFQSHIDPFHPGMNQGAELHLLPLALDIGTDDWQGFGLGQAASNHENFIGDLDIQNELAEFDNPQLDGYVDAQFRLAVANWTQPMDDPFYQEPLAPTDLGQDIGDFQEFVDEGPNHSGYTKNQGSYAEVPDSWPQFW